MRNSMPILLVEDEPTDIILVKRALKDSEIASPLVHSINCKEALEHLNDRNNKKPGVIITDLNTPEIDGFEFMRIIKADDVLWQIRGYLLRLVLFHSRVSGMRRLSSSVRYSCEISPTAQ